jgi:predicted phage baseplate assembly protein
MTADPPERCGCCEAEQGTLPQPARNGPGLPAIGYRLGTYAAFRTAMIRQIGRDDRLRAWTARGSDDYGIALVEMWAYVADVLTFYIERTANESFLRTATARESVRRLVGLLGYRPSPGLAAIADLAFVLDPDAEVELGEGLAVQSVPQAREEPQRFETVETVAARAALNRVPVLPAPVPVAALAAGRSEAPLRPGSAVPGAGQAIVVFDPEHAELKTALAPRERAGRTVAAWAPPVQGELSAFGSRIALTGRSFGLFGRSIPLTWLEHEVVGTDVKYELKTQSETLPPSKTLTLDAVYPGLREGADVLIVSGSGSTRRATVLAARQTAKTFANFTDTVTELELGLRATSTPRLVDASGSRPAQAFVVADDGALWTMARVTDPSWQSLGGDVEDFEALRGPDGRLTVLATGRDGGVWQRTQAAGAEFEPWERVSASGRFRTVSGAIEPGGRTHVVAGSAHDGTLHHTSREAAGEWEPWRALPAVEVSEHRAVYAHGALRVIALGEDGALSAGGASLAEWRSLGGAYDMFAVTVRDADRVDVLARRHDSHAIERRWLAGGVWTWTSGDTGQAAEALSATTTATGLLVAVTAGADGALRRGIETAAGSALSWAAVGTAAVVDLDVARGSGGALEALMRSDEGALQSLGPASPMATSWGVTDVDPPTWPIDDLRAVTVHELEPAAIEPADREPPDTIAGSVVHVALDRAGGLERGRRVVLDDGAGEAHSALVTDTSEADLDGDGASDHVAVAFTPALTRDLETDTAVLLGNVVRATHGATQPEEALGHGDASLAMQAFRLSRAPLTMVPSPGAPRGARPALDLRVGGIRWDPVEELYGRRADEQVYVLATDDEGRTTVRFGDGRTGARLPTGRGNVRARYRAGLGLAGNVGARALRNPLTKPKGVRSVSNPVRAGGGADPETADDARAAGPNSVRTFGRVVSLRDYADAAREFAAVAKARASLAWDGDDEQIRLVVAGPDGSELTEESLQALVLDLEARRDPHRGLRVVAHDPVPIVVGASVAPDPSRIPEDVVAAARTSVVELLSFARQDFGRAVHLGEVYAALHGTPGVVWAQVTQLRRKDAPATGAPAETVPIGPSELAELADAAADLTVTAT